MTSITRYHLLQSDRDQLNMNDEDDTSSVQYINGNRKASKKDVYWIFNGIVVILILLVGLFFIFSMVLTHSKKFQRIPSQKGKSSSNNLPPDRSFQAPAAFPYRGYRLPNHVYPTYYTIHFHPNYDRLITSGNMVIAISCRKKTNFIVLHKEQIAIASISVGRADDKNSSIKVVQTIENPARNFYYIQLQEHLLPHHQYVIYMKFTSHIRTKLFTGFYRTQYTTATGVIRLVSYYLMV